MDNTHRRLWPVLPLKYAMSVQRSHTWLVNCEYERRHVWDRSMGQEYPVTSACGYSDRPSTSLFHIAEGTNRTPYVQYQEGPII